MNYQNNNHVYINTDPDNNRSSKSLQNEYEKRRESVASNELELMSCTDPQLKFMLEDSIKKDLIRMEEIEDKLLRRTLTLIFCIIVIIIGIMFVFFKFTLQ